MDKNIIPLPEGYFVASQNGSYLFNRNFSLSKLELKGALNHANKAAIKYNDTLLVLGSHAKCVIYDIKTRKITDSVTKRVTALAKGLDGNIYIGSVDGLYRWNGKEFFSYGSLYK
ncbi:MAG: hypothetical protein N2747_03730 [Chitinophagaceae bacterium]|nr:hypothetical protein [Chitinophagaceae bacterium]